MTRLGCCSLLITDFLNHLLQLVKGSKAEVVLSSLPIGFEYTPRCWVISNTGNKIIIGYEEGLVQVSISYLFQPHHLSCCSSGMTIDVTSSPKWQWQVFSYWTVEERSHSQKVCTEVLFFTRWQSSSFLYDRSTWGRVIIISTRCRKGHVTLDCLDVASWKWSSHSKGGGSWSWSTAHDLFQRQC